MTHGPGSLWLSGGWPADRVTKVTSGLVRAVFMGTCRFGPARAQAAVEQAVAAGSYDQLALLPGNFHLAVLAPDGTHLYGDVAGLRRLFHTSAGSATAYASHAVVLAWLTGAAVNDAKLATLLACRFLDHVLERIPLFTGVRPVPAAHRLTIDPGGRASAVPYWSVPAADRCLADSAEALRAQLTEAVEVRARAVPRVTCDLSGGLDSTSVSFLAARAAASLCTVTYPATAQANDDWTWARDAAAGMPGAAHVFIEAREYPLPYQDLRDLPVLDEPVPLLVVMAQLRHVAGVVAGQGSLLHFGGYGADAVLLSPLAYLVRTLRTDPFVALVHLRGYWARGRLPPARAALRALVSAGSYRSWLRAADRGLEDPHAGALAGPDGHPLTLEWGGLPQVPGWLTTGAVELARGSLAESASVLAPLAPSPAQHAAMEAIRYEARRARLRQDAYAGLGVRIEQPYLDADVLTTCLATRAHERTDPRRAKPLLAEAMRGIVPASLLARRTKSVYDADFHLGWQEHRAEILAVLEDSRLAARGLVDAEALRAASRTPDWADPPLLVALNDTLACELWLRTLDGVGG